MFSTEALPNAVAIHLVCEEELTSWRQQRSVAAREWLANCAFRAERNQLALLPNASGAVDVVVAGLGKKAASTESIFWVAAGLPDRLPAGRYRAVGLSGDAINRFARGWAYGKYKFERYKKAPSDKAQTLELAINVDGDSDVDVIDIERVQAGCALARDLVNTPANDLSPADLANTAVDIAGRYGANILIVVGDELLAEKFPAIHAVGRASSVAPRLIDMQWGDELNPKVTLVGKGVCFDSGGLDIKPGASMLLMKKDMGGAASVLGLAQIIMDARLPVRLRVIIPAVENAVSGNSFRPGDVLQTRKGITVEVGNTDAEGRLVLADALTLADADQPDLLVDLATLTGAARVALGPELPALFTADDQLASELQSCGINHNDALWRLPLWPGYDDEFSSKIADINNVSSSGFSGAIIGALFLKRFVAQAKTWAHIDMYAWNSKERPGRPVGAEPQCVRALYACLLKRYPKA